MQRINSDISDSHKNALCCVCGATSLREVYRTQEFYVLRCPHCNLDQCPTIKKTEHGASKVTSSITPERLVEGYKNNFFQSKELCLSMMAARIPALERALGRKLQSVCEVGCASGVGYYPYSLRGIEWVGLETNPKWEAHGKEFGIPILSRDLADLNKKFDLIYLHQVLEHIEEPLKFMRQLRKHLLPGGMVYIDVPNHEGFTALKRRLWPKSTPSEFGFIQYPYHLRAYSSKSLRTLLEKSGFRPLRVRAVRHTHPCWGQWDSFNASTLRRVIFYLGGLCNLGTLLYGVGKADDAA